MAPADPAASAPSVVDQVLAQGVVIAPDGTRVAGARVSFVQAERGTSPLCVVGSDDRGRFQLRESDLTVAPSEPDALFTLSARAESIDGRRASLLKLVLPERDRPLRTLVLVLREAARVRGRVVHASGDTAGGATLLVLSFPRSDNTWEVSEGDGGRRIETTDAAGAFDVVVPPGHVRLFGRAGTGAFGPSVRIDVAAGDDVDVGVVTAGGESVHFELSVLDQAGQPIADASVRLAPDDGVQRLSSSLGDDWVHYRTDSAGRAAFDVRRAHDPLILGVGHPLFETVEVVADRSTHVDRAIELHLAARPQIDVHIVGPDDAPVSSDLDVSLRLRRVGDVPVNRDSREGTSRTDTGIRRVLSGLSEGATFRRDGQMSPAQVLARRLGKRHGAELHSPGGYSIRPTRLGRYVVSIRAQPGVVAEAGVDLDEDDPTARVVHRLPPGRLVRVRAVLPTAGISSTSAWRLWATPPSDRRDAWPETPGEYRVASNTGWQFLSGVDRGAREIVRTVWVPATATELIARDLRPSPRDQEVLRAWGSHGPRTTDSGEGGVLNFAPLTRVAIPAGENVTVTLPVPTDADAARGAAVSVRVHVVLGTADVVPLQGVTVRARSVDTPVRRVASTDAGGVASFALPPGMYEFVLSPRDAPPGKRSIEVPADSSDGLDVTIDLSDRAW